MKAKFLLLGGVLTALTLATVSCSKDDDEDGGFSQVQPGEVPMETGVISSGTSLDRELPAGYRLASVGSCSFYYGNNGRLEGFDWYGDYFPLTDGKFSFQDEGVTTNIAFNNQGFISQGSESINIKESGITEKGSANLKCAYNSNNQLTSLSMSGAVEYSEEGYKGKFSYGVNCTLTYSGSKLTKVVVNAEESEGGYKESEKQTLTFIYDENYPNPYGQYTQTLMNECFAEMLNDPLVYLGLFGRASSVLPSSIFIEETETEDGETSTKSHTKYCGPYRYNEYGALSYADGNTYTYTTVGSRSLSAMPALGQQQTLGLGRFITKRFHEFKNRK